MDANSFRGSAHGDHAMPHDLPALPRKRGRAGPGRKAGGHRGGPGRGGRGGGRGAPPHRRRAPRAPGSPRSRGGPRNPQDLLEPEHRLEPRRGPTSCHGALSTGVRGREPRWPGPGPRCVPGGGRRPRPRPRRDPLVLVPRRLHGHRGDHGHPPQRAAPGSDPPGGRRVGCGGLGAPPPGPRGSGRGSQGPGAEAQGHRRHSPLHRPPQERLPRLHGGRDGILRRVGTPGAGPAPGLRRRPGDVRGPPRRGGGALHDHGRGDPRRERPRATSHGDLGRGLPGAPRLARRGPLPGLRLRIRVPGRLLAPAPPRRAMLQGPLAGPRRAQDRRVRRGLPRRPRHRIGVRASRPSDGVGGPSSRQSQT